MTRAWLLSALAVVGVLGICDAKAQANQVCRPPDSDSEYLVAWVKHVVTSPGGGAMQQQAMMKLPEVSASEITYVTDESVCTQALAPYNQNSVMRDATSGAPVQPSGELYVVKVGRYYVVKDPAKKSGEFTIVVTLDQRFRVLWSGLG